MNRYYRDIKQPQIFHEIERVLPDGINKDQLIIISDVHFGADNHANDLWEEVLDWITKQHDNGQPTFVITNGDLCETGTKRSYGTFEQVCSPQEQMDEMVEYLKPLVERDMLIGMIDGNHERRVARNSSISVTKNMATILGVPYFKYGIFLRTKVRHEGDQRSKIYDGYITHGSSGAWTLGGKLNAIERLAKICTADYYAMGHVHTLMNIPVQMKDPSYNKMKNKTIHYILTGSYMNYVGSYAQQKARRPSNSLGSPKIFFHADQQRMSVKC